MTFPTIHKFVLPILITAHSEEDAQKMKASIFKLYLDHGVCAGTIGTVGIEFKSLQKL